MTNRDVYLLVRHIGDRADESGLSLEAYLRALWSIARIQRDTEPGIERVTTWLEQALTEAVPPFDDTWRAVRPDFSSAWGHFEAWERMILFQIADLRRMAESGQLEDEQRYFGISSPSKHDWYNFDVAGYLECGVRGTLGGYELDDVIVLIEHDPPLHQVTNFGWGDFADLLHCGQIYE